MPYVASFKEKMGYRVTGNHSTIDIVIDKLDHKEGYRFAVIKVYGLKKGECEFTLDNLENTTRKIIYGMHLKVSGRQPYEPEFRMGIDCPPIFHVDRAVYDQNNKFLRNQEKITENDEYKTNAINHNGQIRKSK